MHEFHKFIFGIKLHVSDSSSVHHQFFFFTAHTAMVYVRQVCWELASNLSATPLLYVEWKPPDDGQMNVLNM
jgi:hypothetical protein